MDHSTRRRWLPNSTQIPNHFLDWVMQDLTESEIKVAFYILRRTFGFQKDGDRISLSQLVDGITRHDGRRLDRGTGLARSSVVRGIKGLEARGLLQIHRIPGTKKSSPETTYYSLLIEDDQASPKLQSPQSQIEFAASPKSSNELVPNCDPQNPDQDQEAKEVDPVGIVQRYTDLQRLTPPREWPRLVEALHRGDPDVATLRARVEDAIAKAKRRR